MGSPVGRSLVVKGTSIQSGTGRDRKAGTGAVTEGERGQSGVRVHWTRLKGRDPPKAENKRQEHAF